MNHVNNDTIVAIATANGIGSISIIRISGDKALKSLGFLCDISNITPRKVFLKDIYSLDKNIIDQAIVIYFKAPFSFTGEDIVEIQCHGGVAVSSMIIDELLKTFILRPALAGEFSKRAFLNGKIDLSQAEAISKLIESKSSASVKILARQLKGELKEFVEQIRESLLYALAYSEVTIDYADEDLPQDIFNQILSKLNSIKTQLELTLESSKRREGLLGGFKVAIIGKPNVGKSSLLNKLLNYDRAIVSNIAGTTRDTIEESIKIGTHIIKLVDTAGIRDAKDSIEQIGILKSKEAIDEADIVIALFDNSTTIDAEDIKILNLIQNSHKEIIIALNKCDLDNSFDTKRLDKYIPISTKEDISQLLKELEKILDEKNVDFDEMMLISKNQVLAVENTLANINLAFEPLQDGVLELFSHHINEALDSISTITRTFDNDEMLDKMFSSFCLGK
ncbi:MAG: tRNA uridine-5-carboxymethylaminomethyl(34) synthesis GTPase MnmE [Arcobacter butzleri]|nr:tRNA uridine-5-carboxymethylaminomethyl(34) synthesis GTPase MnmE [Aliarcobacter butzleri]